MKFKFLFLATFLFATLSQAQNQLSSDTLSLEELMNIPITSASKKKETLFEAPLSSYTITRNEISNSGATTIMEALRLSPGLIVRQQTNGEYDIHIRGMENLQRTNGTFLKGNTTTLVMIDNRPVFNQGLGGTYWESLSIDINDIDRIEIVRGPSSPLFGPNAVTGVINIITRRMGSSKTVVNANLVGGSNSTVVANATIGKKLSDKFDLLVSGNYQDRSRFDNTYYNSTAGAFQPLSTFVPQSSLAAMRYPNPSRALNKYGVNTYLTFKPSEKVSFDLTLNNQGATYQREFINSFFNYSSNSTSSANLAATIHNFKLRTSYTSGHNYDLKYEVPSGEYDYSVFDATAEYDIKVGEHNTITPGVSYMTTTWDDSKYSDLANGVIGYLNAKQTISTSSAYLRTDWNFTDKWRVIAALRADKFSVPDQTYLAYELASTYKINSKNLIRFAITRSNSGSFIGYNYLNIAGAQVGNTNLKIFTLDMQEIGYRLQATDKLQFDIDAFVQSATNLSALLQGATNQQFSNIPTTATQVGATLSINYAPSDKIQVKPFITIQSTQTKDLPSLYIDPSFAQAASIPLSYSNSQHLYTPSSYGGFYFNYKASSKWIINVSNYFFGSQVNYDGSYDVNDPASKPAQYAQGQISSKFLINTKVSYEAFKGFNVFVTGRNVFNSNSREFLGSDPINSMWLTGLSYKLN
jgi:iron complex outermembrane receptor protein